MKRSTPMKRTGFKRPEFVRLDPAPMKPGLVLPPEATSTEQYEQDVAAGKVRHVTMIHRGTYAGSTTGVAMPKEPRLENPNLLLMARNQPRPCLIVVPGLCVSLGRETSCCACHGNSHVWNKGGHQKAHDFFSVWGCARCHDWLDNSYSASSEERDHAFRVALGLQIAHWDTIATNPTGKPADVEATRWALSHLMDRGYAMASPYTGRFAIPNLQRIYGRE